MSEDPKTLRTPLACSQTSRLMGNKVAHQSSHPFKQSKFTERSSESYQVQFSATETPKEHKLFGVLCKNTLGHFFWPASQRMRTVKIIRQCFSAAMTGIQCVVFDLDDTLWSTAATLEHAHEAPKCLHKHVKTFYKW